VLNLIFPIDLVVNNIINYNIQLPLGVVCLNQEELTIGLDDIHSDSFGFDVELSSKHFYQAHSFLRFSIRFDVALVFNLFLDTSKHSFLNTFHKIIGLMFLNLL